MTIPPDKKGLIILYTGNGKGKTTAALGIMLRAWGHGMRCCMLQFLKSPDADYGEYDAARKMGVDIRPLGDGCTWQSPDLEIIKETNLEAWNTAWDVIANGGYDLVVLDEFTLVLNFGWLDTSTVVDWLKANKPLSQNIIMTGRYAPQELIDMADLVTEMKEIKHPYKDKGISSQPGVDR